MIVRILMSLGYYICEDVKQEHQMMESNTVIKRWINILREDEIESPNTLSGFQNTVWLHGTNSTTGSGTESMKTAIN